MGFFDGLTKKGAEISNSLQESINKSQRISALKKSISENNSKVARTFSEIGRKIYEKRTMDEEIMTFISGKIEEIDNAKKENEELEKELLGLNNKKRCPECGTEVDLNATFCPVCGKEQEKVEIEPFIPNGKRKCSGCGEIIDDNSVFCPKCGAKKEEVVEATEENKEADEISEAVENSEAVEETAETTEKNEEVEEVTEVVEKNEEVEKAEEVVEETIPEGKRKCSGCGEIIDDADIFCANCGTKKEETEENK